MAITLRCGAYKDFDPNKLLTAELAVVLEGDPRASNGRSLYACYKPGVVKQIATYEDMVEFLKASMSDTSEQIAEELAKQFTENLLTATNAANNAAEAADVATQTISELKTQIQEEESKRVSAETKRQQDTTKAINEVNNATKAANDAAEAANTAAQEGKNYEGTLETFPIPGKKGIFYIDKNTNIVYRWDFLAEDYIPLGGGSTSSGDMSIISDGFDSNRDYLKGDYTIKDNVLYKFTSDKSVGEWDETVAKATTVGAEVQALNANMRGTILWENPDPTVAFPAKAITLSSADYDYYEIYYNRNTTGKYMMCQRALKGYGCYLNWAGISGSGAMSNRRLVTFVSDTNIDINAGESAVGATQSYQNNDTCIPVRIVGYKS